jgi:tetratricopeptide (TPR) repeat protein
VPEGDVQALRSLTSQLASHFESIQQLKKALAIREQMAKEPLPPEIAGHSASGYESMDLARLYEQMGEVEKAEAAWKEAAAERQHPPSGSGVVATLMMGSFSIGGSQTALAGFYQRRGRIDEAEQIYKKQLADADERGSWEAWIRAADAYIAFLHEQKRLNEATDLLRQAVVRIEFLPGEIAAHVLHARLQHLAGLYTEAGRFDDALAVHRQAIEAAQACGSGSLESFQAYTSLAETLLQQNRLEDAERAVDGMREAALAVGANQQYYESMTAQTLARIRDKQNRPEEARELRATATRIESTPDRVPTVFDLVGPAQQAVVEGKTDDALAAVEPALSLAAERTLTNPQEVSGLTSLAQVLLRGQQEEAARRIVVETSQLLRQAPNHPRISDALGSVISALAQLGMAAEAEQAIERQERILVAAKGADSLALNAVGHASWRALRSQPDARASKASMPCGT